MPDDNQQPVPSDDIDMVATADFILRAHNDIATLAAGVADFIVKRRPELNWNRLVRAIAREFEFAVTETVELAQVGWTGLTE